MFDPLVVLLCVLGYVALLVLLARWVERGTVRSRRLADSPTVYALSLAVYCTTWTFYGSVGKCVTSGMAFLTVYLGPTLALLLWGGVLRKMVQIKSRRRITSIADFIAARYDRSAPLGALAALFALVGTMPYIALQIKAVTTTYGVITHGAGPADGWTLGFVGLVCVVLMVGFTIVFGVRRLDPTERHQGMIAAVAAESLVKLAALTACGLFATFWLFAGPGDLLAAFERLDPPQNLFFGQTEGPAAYADWSASLVLGMSAILFLPRQFHIAVIECPNQLALSKAQWLFPLYLLAINLFVAPLAMAGLASGLPAARADSFVLLLPLEHNLPVLTLLVFLGGASAAMSMVMIASMTLSTMVVNHLALPALAGSRWSNVASRRIRQLRWTAVGLVIFGGYAFERILGESLMLVDMGMISFAAVLQFAPALLAGLRWPKASKTGALLGLAAGFVLWFWTLLVPAFVKSGWLGADLLAHGPLGLEFLRPEALFGLTALPRLSHGVFWSLGGNMLMLALGSTLRPATSSEEAQAREFMGAQAGHAIRSEAATVNLGEKLPRLETLLLRYFPPDLATHKLADALERADLTGLEMVSLPEYSELVGEVEAVLAGVLGQFSGRQAIAEAQLYTEQETRELSATYVEMLAELRLTPTQLREKLDYHLERERLMARHAVELERTVEDRTVELRAANKELEAFSYSVSHDLRAPLRTIDGFSHVLTEDYGEALGDTGKDHLRRVRAAAQRMGRLIDELLTLGRVTRTELQRQDTDLSALMHLVAGDLRQSGPDRDVVFDIAPGLTSRCDPGLVRILLQNLMGNAWKFTARTELARIELGVEDLDGARFFFVRDNGAGFDPAYGHKLFTAFNRLHNPEEFEGTGIGLAIVLQVVRRHGGEIRARGDLGRGATFYFRLNPTSPDTEP